ncbi:hypothetical protein [Microbacterium sp. NPDC057944]|uniref:hypothetical protein n=1 Tax=Microbacterium sp. NPDC057944 TaxID=3346286 RepID=UPI0036DF48F8
MRLRHLLAISAATILLVSGCAPTPTPEPSASPSAATPTPTPTPTQAPPVEPTPAFTLTCADVGAALAAVIGEPSTPMHPALSTVSTMNWIPGPAQYMFQRAGGIACSAGDESAHWEVAVVPDGPDVFDGALERGAPLTPGGGCESGGCTFELTEGDVHLSATMRGPWVDANAAGIESALRALVATAAANVRVVALADSDIVGARCERFLTAEELSALLGTEAVLQSSFGGWGIPAEVYEVVNGSTICYFRGPGDEYSSPALLQITGLPAGAWAFDRQEGTPVVVEGADEAKTSAGEHGETHLDLRVGPDWIRMTTYDGSASSDPLAIAVRLVRNLTVGHLAPQ